MRFPESVLFREGNWLQFVDRETRRQKKSLLQRDVHGYKFAGSVLAISNCSRDDRRALTIMLRIQASSRIREAKDANSMRVTAETGWAEDPVAVQGTNPFYGAVDTMKTLGFCRGHLLRRYRSDSLVYTST